MQEESCARLALPLPLPLCGPAGGVRQPNCGAAKRFAENERPLQVRGVDGGALVSHQINRAKAVHPL